MALVGRLGSRKKIRNTDSSRSLKAAVGPRRLFDLTSLPVCN